MIISVASNVLYSLFQATILNSSTLDQMETKWALQSALMCDEYSYVESVLTLRCVLLELAASSIGETGTSARRIRLSQLENLARVSREAGQHQVSHSF